MTKNLIIDINKAIELKINLEGGLLLYCIYINNKGLLMEYVTSCNKISTETIKDLESKGLINISSAKTDSIFFELLSLTELGLTTVTMVIFTDQPQINLESNFEDFRKHYPKVVKSGTHIRRLHTNLKKCKLLYDKLLMETTHDILCRAADLYYKEKKDSNSEMFMQNLDVWLNQRNYELYLDDLTKPSSNIKEQEKTNYDAI